jgi:AcrR family transcriptional regulator
MSAEEVKDKAVQLTIRRIREEGYEKVRLVDIAKELGVSHVALYSHFADKSTLIHTVTQQWLAKVDTALDMVCSGDKDPFTKLHELFLTLHRMKRDRVVNDPELYKAFNLSVDEMRPFVRKHLENVDEKVLRLVEEAAAIRRLNGKTPLEAKAILLAGTIGFTHPRLVEEQLDEEREGLLGETLDALLGGLFLDTPA